MQLVMSYLIMAIYKKLFIFGLKFFRHSLGNDEITVAPKDTESATGANVTLYCKSSIAQIEWHHIPIGHSIHEIVYQDGFIFNGYRDRFSVNRKDNGEYNLVIKNVKATDAGKYTCVENSDYVVQKTAELVVFEQYPSNKFCSAKFTCAPDCDILELTCSMKSNGNLIPSMEWRESANGILASNLNTENGIATSSVRLQPKGLTAQSFSCEVMYPTHSSLISQFSWSYSISVPAAQDPPAADEKLQVQPNQESFIVMFALMATGLVVMTIVTVILLFKNKRLSRNFLTFRNKSILVNSYGPPSNRESFDPKDVENNPLSEDLLTSRDANEGACGIVPRTSTNKDKSIHGIGALGDEVFLVTRNGCIIEVFHLETAKFKRALMVEGLINPNDMAVCPIRNLIFICDWKKAAEEGEIFCCDKNGKLNCRWISEHERGRISITKETNVIVAENYFNTIKEYTYFGRLIKKFDTGRQKFHLWHAVKLENGNFVASFGDANDEIQEICIIDGQGTTLHSINQDSYLQKHGLRFSVPRSLAVDREGIIYVCDLYNGRIILLTPELQYNGKIDEGEKEEKLRGPLRICIHESHNNRALMVADSVKMNGNWTDGRVLVWNLSP